MSRLSAAEPHTEVVNSKTTMTRNEEELSRDEHVDQRVLVDCIKNDLFPKAKFVLGEDEWDVGGVICKDCIKCC